jgi:penicillin-binding protein 2
MSSTLMPDNRRGLTIRLTVLQYVVAVAFGALAVGFWVFQIAQHDKFLEMAENNRLRKVPLPAPRGLIVDREGRVLVDNQSTFSIVLDREQTKNIPEVLRTVAAATGVSEAQLRDTVNRRRKDPTYRPIVLIDNATLPQVIAISARALELPGVHYEPVPSRRYPENAAAHLFGYVGEVSDVQLQKADFEGIDPGTIVGQAGVEQAFNKALMGTEGNKTVVVNSVGREIQEVKKDDPIEGHRVQLTIDADIQKAVDDGISASGFNGAAVILDPSDGDVLAFTSHPAYDPNAFAAGIDRNTWQALNSDPLKPLQDRALQGRYSPGSTFKMAVALAGLEEGVITPDFKVHCTGSANFYGRPFACWAKKKGGHGTIDLRHAIEQSCDVYFYTVANMVGIDKINKWATLLGLGVKSGIDLPNELVGLVPSTKWKMETKHEKWYAGETISVGIGQGQVSVTPVSMAVYMATLANGGTRVTPHLLKAVDGGTGWKPVPPPPPQSQVAVDPDKLQAIRDGLWLVVNGAGTGATARIQGHDVSGKTGSAQVISNQGRVAAQRAGKGGDLRDNGWFVFFAPRDKPTIAGVVFLEHGIHGGNAARVAHHILATYFAKVDGKPLPPPPTHDDLHLDYSDPYAKGGPVGSGGGH